MAPDRLDGRSPGQIRHLSFERGWTSSASGSVLVRMGLTRVLCTATVTEGVPLFLKNSDQGWLTAEYSMLPGSTTTRKQRDRLGKVDGRSVEIQRLIGRALRAIVDRRGFPNRTLWVDCDVLQADGGTRVASINGAYVALHDAFTELKEAGQLHHWPLKDSVQAISVGLLDGEPVVDLNYHEDSQADVDLNLVLTGQGRIVEVSGGAEQGTFDFEQLQVMLDGARRGIAEIGRAQQRALAG